ncbi:hypothetical protein G6F56_005305 [Rhizopus delemar]|nr:hypothetical protein G6F56_005305 [Rhizopus delemar]
MLETNKPFMFGSSTNATSSTNNNNTNSPTNASTELPSPKSVLTGPVNSYYFKQEEKEPCLPSYQGQPARLNSAFSHPEEYAYKPNNSSSSSSNSHGPNYAQLLPMSHYSPPPASNLMKHVKEPFIHSMKNDYTTTFDETESWFDAQYEGEFGDNRKVKRRKEMTLKMERLNIELYDEKLLSINNELKESRKDTHTTYLDGLRDLENMRQKMIDDGQLFREYQKQMADHQFELEIYQAEEENSLALTQPANCSIKRRMEDNEDEIVFNDTKRYFDLNTKFSPVEAPKDKDLPSITYASPDYRPPPTSEVPLWLQPVAASPATEDDSEDDTPLSTPVKSEYWGEDMSIDHQ